jgi:radical SAM superfamily enzyme YgiQ (UPF0313 family)
MLVELELISPANEDSTYVPSLGMAVVAAHTPPDVRVHYTDDLVAPIDLARGVKPVDLCAITVNSKTARRAYDIADAYRRAGVKVVLGGIHATAVPDEALTHGDAVVVGEAEGLWERVVADFQAGALAPVYRHTAFPSLAGLPRPRRDIFRSPKYIPFQLVQTTRGCPYPCEFCSVSTYNGGKFRFRPVPEVVGEIASLARPRALPKKLILFADDNVMIHERYSRELFSAMVPLGVHWIGQASLAGLHKVDNVALMARSGCRAVFIGFESVDDETVRGAGKKQNKPGRYSDVIRKLHDHGIAVWGSFVFGFDEDDDGVFDRTVEFCIRTQLTMALFAILTPYPGTMLYRRLAAEGRLTKDRWWLGQDHDRELPFYRPRRMSPDRLREGWIGAWRSFYSYSSIWRRYRFDLDASWIALVGHFPLNLLMHQLAERKIAGGERLFRRPGPARRWWGLG